MSRKTNAWIRQLTESFGPVYAALIERIAGRERAIAVSAVDLDIMNVEAVTAHLVELHELNGIRIAAYAALQATGVMSEPVSPSLPTDHVRQLLMRWQADTEHPGRDIRAVVGQPRDPDKK